MYHQINIKQFYFLPTQWICVFCVDLRTNSRYFPTQHWLTAFYNRDGVCLLRGTGWIFWRVHHYTEEVGYRVLMHTVKYRMSAQFSLDKFIISDILDTLPNLTWTELYHVCTYAPCILYILLSTPTKAQHVYVYIYIYIVSTDSQISHMWEMKNCCFKSMSRGISYMQ
jgi:hypothetical protein